MAPLTNEIRPISSCTPQVREEISPEMKWEGYFLCGALLLVFTGGFWSAVCMHSLSVYLLFFPEVDFIAFAWLYQTNPPQLEDSRFCLQRGLPESLPPLPRAQGWNSILFYFCQTPLPLAPPCTNIPYCFREPPSPAWQMFERQRWCKGKRTSDASFYPFRPLVHLAQ